MKKRVPDKYKYLFESPKPFSECSLKEKAVYAYFDNLEWQKMQTRDTVFAVIAGVLIGLVIVTGLLLLPI